MSTLSRSYLCALFKPKHLHSHTCSLLNYCCTDFKEEIGHYFTSIDQLSMKWKGKRFGIGQNRMVWYSWSLICIHIGRMNRVLLYGMVATSWCGTYGRVWYNILRMVWHSMNHSMVYFGTAWYIVIWCDLVWYGIVCLALCDMVWRIVTWYGMVRQGQGFASIRP